MTAQLYDFASRRQVSTFGATVTCIGGQQSLFFEIAVTGMNSDRIASLVNKDFRNVQIIDQHLLGMNASVIDPTKLRIVMTFPVGATINDPAKVHNLCRMLSERLTPLAQQAVPDTS